mmetsp:Transcript_2941/g.6206  ORF Transcript_2941/g.6206 Transcript_2941/m.6206 type:complete len:135 (+) Transcript_2941:1796-2200(+)
MQHSGSLEKHSRQGSFEGNETKIARLREGAKASFGLQATQKAGGASKIPVNLKRYIVCTLEACCTTKEHAHRPRFSVLISDRTKSTTQQSSPAACDESRLHFLIIWSRLLPFPFQIHLLVATRKCKGAGARARA